MKKLFVAMTLLMGLGASTLSANTLKNEVEVSVMVNEFTPIEVKELPKAVQDAIAKAHPDSVIKEAAIEVKPEGPKTYKVVLTDKANTDSTVFYGEDGTKV